MEATALAGWKPFAPASNRQVPFRALAVWLLTATVALVALMQAYPAPARPSSFAARFEMPVGTEFLKCAGHGSPTIILEAGYGESSGAWDAVWPALAATSRVCAWDRPGRGESEPLPLLPATGAELMTALHDLLAEADEPGPYVLVGFSVGGMLVRTFSTLYPDEVAGMVLIDPTPPAWLQASIDRAVAGTRVGLERRHAGLDEREPERIDLLATAASLTSAPAPAVPVMMLTAGITAPKIAGSDGDSLSATLATMQATDAARLGATHCVAAGTTHDIPAEDPLLVASAIEQVVSAVRSGQLLSSCGIGIRF